MRQIKFRAWDDVNDEMIFFDLNNRLRIIVSDLIEKELVMQFTGLKDRKGIEIYEGDILRSHKDNKVTRKEAYSKVFWMDSHSEFQHTWNEGNGFHPSKEFWNNEPLWKVACIFSPPTCEIIGNIYENPDLIK